MPDTPTPHVTAVDLLAFLGELVLLAALAVAGARLGDGLAGWAMAIGFPALLGVVWGWWLAPRASRRLRYPARLVVKLALVLVSTALLAGAGLPVWALALSVVVGAVFAVAEVQDAKRSAVIGR